MKIKLSSTLACTAVLAFAPGAGDTGRAAVDAAARPGTMYFLGRTRPLCAYPAYARYSAIGNLEDSANFTCTAPSDSAPAHAASPVRDRS
jgi:hypothetical protein